jgi:hypothetical protein
MAWFSKEANGIEELLETIRTLLPKLGEFDCIRITIREGLRLILLQKPWPGTNYVLSGNLTPPETGRVLEVGRQLQFKHFSNTPATGDHYGLSLCSASQEPAEVETACRKLSESLSAWGTKFLVEGSRATVNFYCEPGGKC